MESKKLTQERLLSVAGAAGAKIVHLDKSIVLLWQGGAAVVMSGLAVIIRAGKIADCLFLD